MTGNCRTKQNLTPKSTVKGDDRERSTNSPRKKQKPRSSANARERSRMRTLSKAFVRLKTTLPWVPADTKLSKLDTLRLATSYIAHLQAILERCDDSSSAQVSGERSEIIPSNELPRGVPTVFPGNMTWPYLFAPRFSGSREQMQDTHTVKHCEGLKYESIGHELDETITSTSTNMCPSYMHEPNHISQYY